MPIWSLRPWMGATPQAEGLVRAWSQVCLRTCPRPPGVAPESGIRAGRPFSAAAGRRIASSTDRPAGVSALAQRTRRGSAENARPWATGNVEP